MNRREMFKSLGGATIAAAAIKPESIKVARATGAINLDPGCVMANMRVSMTVDDRSFELTLMEKPWPQPGERIVFSYDGLLLVGDVRQVDYEPHHGRGRCWCHVKGKVIEFDGRPMREPRRNG